MIRTWAEELLNPDGAVSISAHVTNDLLQLAMRYVSIRKGAGEFTSDTAGVIRYTLSNLVSSIGRRPSAGDLSPAAIEEWLASRPVALSTKRRQLSEVRTFCRWLVLHGHLPSDPTLWIKGPKQPRPAVRAQRAADVHAVIDACADARERCMVLLMVQLGLRCVEVARLQLGDVDLVAGVLQVEGKGGHWRVLPVTAEAGTAIGDYLMEHPAVAGPLIRAYSGGRSCRAMTGVPGRAISAQTVSKIVARVCAEAGVHRRAHDGATAHSLRHTMAKDILDRGADLRDVQTALGHANLATTSRYVGLTGLADLRVAMEGRSYLHD